MAGRIRAVGTYLNRESVTEIHAFLNEAVTSEAETKIASLSWPYHKVSADHPSVWFMTSIIRLVNDTQLIMLYTYA